MPTRALVLSLSLLMMASTSIGVMAQSATPGIDTAIGDHLTWVMNLFEGGAAELTIAEVEEHLGPAFLDVVPTDEFLASVQEIAPLLGPLELVEEQREGLGEGEFIGVFEAESGDLVTIAFAVDPESRLIAGFFIAPAENPVLAATPNVRPETPPVASPAMSERGSSRNPGGNLAVIETAEDEYIFIAHIQQGSVQVEVGDEVRAGELLGLTGNSGNSSEPHLHIHIQETADILDFQVAGIPLHFGSVVVDGEPRENVSPVQGDFIAPE